MKNSKTWLILLVNSVLIFGSWHHSESCGYGGEYEVAEFFDTRIIRHEDYKPFYFTMDRLYDYKWNDPKKLQNDNVLAWKKYFEAKSMSTSDSDISYFVYKSTLEELKSLLKKKLPAGLSKNSVAKIQANKPNKALLNYLIFAKKCEPFVYQSDKWKRDKREQISTNMITEALHFAKKSKDPELKLRYLYQAIRLAHYSKDYNKTVEIFDSKLSTKVEHPIYYWALGHKAGALRAQGYEAKAAYLFAKMFDKTKSKRVNAYYSFKVTNQQVWDDVMALCQSNHEKATLYFLRGIKPHSRALEEMKKINAIEPNSQYLDILLAREIAKLENRFVVYNTEYNPIKLEKSYVDDLKSFINEKLRDGVQNKALWTLALGYCDYLRADYDAALKSYKSLPASSKDAIVNRQINIFERMVDITRLTKITSEEENDLFEKIVALKHEPLTNMMYEAFGKLYKKQNMPMKAFYATHTSYDLKVEPNLDLVQRSINLINKSSKTALEKTIVKKMLTKDQLNEMKAVLYWRNGDIKQAKGLLVKVKKFRTLKITPFVRNINDCVHCIPNTTTNVLELFKKVEGLELKSKGNTITAAGALMSLGDFYYNVTYYGPAWEVMAYFRSGSSDFNGYLNVHKPLNYYAKALAIFERLGQKEKAAEALMMMSKCEQYFYYQAQKKSYTRDKSPYRSSFKKLKKDYKKTNYFKGAIQECIYFDHYVRIR